MMIKFPFLRMINNMNALYNQQSKLAIQLATGRRINCAADDPAGLAISERMTAQIRGLRQAQRNVLDGVSMIQTAEGSMNEIHSMLQRMREISVQAASGTYSDEDREKLNDEFQQLKEGISQIASDSEFNTIPLLDGSKESNDIRLQVGPNAGDTISFNIGNLTSSGLDIDGLDISTAEGAKEAMGKLDDAIKNVSSQRGKLGAIQNRLEHTLNNLENYELNLSAAVSRIRDVDMAKAIMEYTQNQVRLYAIQAILAQAMKMEQNRVLQLLESLK